MSSRPYYSIGEVLGLLIEEFPDVTISKIRFLETQGLIDPERTPSGYRKFYDGDLERLRFILREQKDRYLPLRVIKERLHHSDDTLPTTPRPLPGGASWATVPGAEMAPAGSASDREPTPAHGTPAHGTPVYAGTTTSAPGTVNDARVERARDGRSAAAREVVPDATPVSSPQVDVTPVSMPAAAAVVPTGGSTAALDRATPDLPVDHRRLTAAELCAEAGIERATLSELESYGLVTSRPLGGDTVYGPDALAVARVTARLNAHGLEVRHLRAWKMNADKETALFEQLVVPLVRQRNPQARLQAGATVEELIELGGALRSALIRGSLRQYLEP